MKRKSFIQRMTSLFLTFIMMLSIVGQSSLTFAQEDDTKTIMKSQEYNREDQNANGKREKIHPLEENVELKKKREGKTESSVSLNGKKLQEKINLLKTEDKSAELKDILTDVAIDLSTDEDSNYILKANREYKIKKQLPNSKDVTPVKSQEDNNSYRLSFDIERPQFSDLDYFNSTYSNYWMSQPKNDVFDEDEWELKDFSVRHNLHVDGYDGPFVRHLRYAAADYSLIGTMHFEDISVPYGEVEVEYYTPKDSGYFEPYLLEYDLYLKKSDNKMILKVPKLRPKAEYTGSEEILEFDNLKIREIGTKLYLDGKSGNDDNDGTTEENAVKSFAKAKELASTNQKIKQIVVIGATDIENDISLEGTNAKVVRGEEFNDYLFNVPGGKVATLKNITIDGNSENNTNIEKSLVQVNRGATLNIGDGAILKNNVIKDISNTATRGGAINASSATINMTEGSIENNQATYGGGIYLNGSIMNFSGGTVQENKSKLVRDVDQFYSAGGGILANEGSTLNMSDGAKVLNNVAGEIGGGISLGSNQWGPTNILNMTGGTVNGNIAGASGGGIFVQAKYFSGGASKAYISRGNITNNKMDGSGVTNKDFGGGGIYVNGANNNYGVNGANGELYLTNVLIEGNKSSIDGAGYAACPVSKTKIYVTDGGAIYDNQSQEKNKIK